MADQSLFDRILAKLATIHAKSTTRRFFKAVERATEAQDALLASMISRGTESAFGRDHAFAKIRTYADFTSNVPVQTYADLLPYIDRVRQGEVGALFRPDEKVLMFALTSGTTAEPKYIPITPQVLADSRRGWNTWGIKAILDHDGTMLRHIVQVTSPMNDHLAPSGIPCGAITGLLAATQKKLVRRYYTSPLQVSGIKDSAAKYYTIMRLAVPRDVAWLVTANPATLLLLARIADEHRESLIRDIHDGTLSPPAEVDDEIRRGLAPRITADVQCARRLEGIVKAHDSLYPKHSWNLGFLAHWCGGTMGLYRSQFPHYFGDVPARDIGLIASEGRMSIPVEDGTAAGVLAITSQFFEFIPAAEYGSTDPTILRSHQVIEGEEYFLVLTNNSGLFRYDMGDRVRVTDWVGQAPLIEFLSRDAHTSSMAGEKLTEDQVVLAMRRLTTGVPERGQVTSDSIVNFVLAPRWAEIPRYRLYVESREAARFLRLAERLDEALRAVSVEYASKRETLRLGRVEVSVLPDGALADRDARLRSRRARTAEQFKHQYLLPSPGLDDELSAAGGSQLK